MKSTRKIIKSIFITFVILIFSKEIFSQDITLEELEDLKLKNVINLEDYEVLKSELEGTQGENQDALYSLTINRRYRNNLYRIEDVKGNRFFPLFEFFKIIEFKNYEKNENKINMTLGKELYENEINFNNKNIKIGKNRENISIKEESIFQKGEEIYIEESLFKKMFLNSLELDSTKYWINMELYFSAPKEVSKILENNIDRFSSTQGNKLMFTNENSLFDLGYLQVYLDGQVNKHINNSYEKNWAGYTEYQGNFLYGEIVTGYDLKNNLIRDTSLYYPEIYGQHSLEVGSYGSKNRELGFSFKKEKGYYYQNKEIIIRENVPIGSKVELLYLGFPLDVKDSENGVIEFRNDELRNDRIYTLKIYTLEGRIYTLEINTAVYFKQQNKGQIEYDFKMRENYLSGKYLGEGNIYYGLSENLTLGGGFLRGVENDQYLDSGKGELIYSNKIFNSTYIILLGSQFAKENRNQNYIQTRLDVEKIRIFSENRNYGSYFKEKHSGKYRVEYLGEGYTLGYNHLFDTDRLGNKSSDYEIDFSAFKTLFRDTLFTTEYITGKNKGDSYSFNIYYTGFYLFNSRVNSKFKNDGKDYTTTLKLMNKNFWEIINFSLEYSHSNREDSRVTLAFNFNYNNWLNSGATYEKSSQNFSLGVNKTVDLKDVSKNIETVNSSRVKVTSYIDKNNNNIWDKDEEIIDNIEVKIGSQSEVTDKNGEAIFFGVPNNLIYDLKITIKKPSFSLGENSLSVKGNKTGTIDVKIPIKPMITLMGNLALPSETAYEKILITIRDDEGTLLDSVMVVKDGTFEISGLFTKKYNLEIKYLGEEFPHSSFVQELILKDNGKHIDTVLIEFNGEKFTLQKKEEVL